jgi:uncharacterized protein DUF4013
VARRVREGDHSLPAWDRPGQKMADGFLMTVVFLIWNIPGVLVSLPADFLNANAAWDAMAAVGAVWGLLVLLAQPAIWAQYLEGGFAGGLDVGAIARRLRFNVGLTIVVGALGIVMSALAASGLIAIGIGVLFTMPYASWVAAHLFGRYARLTDEAIPLPNPSMAPA